MLKGRLQTLRLIVEIRDEHDDTAAREYLGQFVQRFSQPRLAAGFKQGKLAKDRAQVAGPAARRHMGVNMLVKRDEPNRILLAIQKVSQGRGQKFRIGEFRNSASLRISHRRAGVDQQMTLRVRVRAIFLDEVAIRAREQPPVEITQIIAGIVLTIFGEFGREACKGRAMQPGHESLDHGARQEFEGANACEHLWIEKAGGSWRGNRRRPSG